MLRPRLMGILLILLVAAFARIWHFQDAPPGLQHDELFKAQEGRLLVEEGDFRAFYPSNQGHEGGYIWLLGISYLLFGVSTMMVKIPPLFIGLLTVALIYRLAARVYSYRAGVIAAGLTAVSFWPLFISRVGLRAVLVPLVVLLVGWGLWRLYFAAMTTRKRWIITVLTGLTLAYATYTYTSAVAIHAGVAGLIVALVIMDWSRFRQRLPYLAVVLALGLVLSIPMARVRMSDEGGGNRVETINQPWQDLRNGDPAWVIENVEALAGMPYFTGDPEWRYNYKDRPLFGTPVGLLVYAGLLVMLWRVRKHPLNVYLLVTALAGLVPSALTISAPSFLRSVPALPTVMIAIALAIDSLVSLDNRKWVQQAVWATGLVAITVTALTDWNVYFEKWPANDTVQSVYRDDLEQLAAHLREEEPALAFVSTTDPIVLDPLIYVYSNPPDELAPVFFDGRTNLVLSEQEALLFVSPLSPISPPHAIWLDPAQGITGAGQLNRQDGELAYDVYRIGSDNTLADHLAELQTNPVFLLETTPFEEHEPGQWGPLVQYPAAFGDVLQLRGYEIPRTEVTNQRDGINIQLYLQPLVNRLNQPINIFVHILSPAGEIVSQRDFMGVPATSWDTRITFIQDHFVGLPDGLTPAQYFVTMGVYNVNTGQRFPIITDEGPQVDRLILGTVTVTTPE